MTVPILTTVAATLVTGASALMHWYQRIRENRRTIVYLEGMPDYLLNDIGLSPGADIRGVVEQKPTCQAADRDTLHHHATLSHPV